MTTPTKTDPTEKMVREYLRNNPTFLDDNADILESIVVSHDSGSAISLVERQVGILRDRSKEMRGRLDNMLQTAHENGVDIFRIFDALNDSRNLEAAIKSVKNVQKAKKLVEKGSRTCFTKITAPRFSLLS